MKLISRKITYTLLTAAILLSAASCSGGADTPTSPVTEPSAAQTEPAVTATEAPVTTETEAPAVEMSENTEESGEGPAAVSEEVSSGTEESTAPAETTAETTTAVSEEVTTTTSTTAATTAETTTTTTTATTTTTTTTAATTAPPPAAPSPPQINPVSSPGTSVFTADNIVFDYSNAGKGYVSVDYSGNTRLKLLLKLGSGQFDYDIYPGRGVQYITLAQGSGTYTVEIYEMLDNGKFVNSVNSTFAANIADEVNMYTYKNFYVEFGANSACVAKASEVCAGCSTALDKIAAVFKYITDNITYDKQKAATVTSGYIPDPDKVLAAKTGICFDYASLTAAMLRSQGVPTRLITGYASPNIYHAWNEVYTPETGWITVEIQLDGTGFRRIDATFYASAANKQSFADYIANSNNYSNVYVY